MSAEQALAAGCAPRLAAFIRGEAASEDRRLLQALTIADDAT
jgi:hypothetical protein